ncbi:hypothetical protein [Streptosporangium sp. NPDC003464]
MSDDLAQLVRSFASEELILNREDVNAEARGNLMMFGFDPDAFNASFVEQALVAAGEQLSDRFADASGPVTFYAWYDEQAGQSRCSMASVEPDDLPFRGRFRSVDSPAPVLDLMAADAQPGVVSRADLRDDLVEEAAALEKQVEPGFPVFAVKLTRS